MNKYMATDIKWDDVPDEIILPTDMDIPDEIAIDEFGNLDYDAIDDYLSNETGFCHKGYNLEEIDRDLEK